MTRWRFGPVNYGRRPLCRFLCGTAIALTLGAGSQPGQAQTIQSQASEQPPLVQTQPRDFDIPAQPLTSALTAFGDQGGLQVTADTAVLTGLTSQPVSGRMAPEEALARLLAGSGLRYHFTSADTVALERAAAGTENGPAELDAISVEGQLEADPEDLPFMTPGSSAYISREQIDRIPPSSPGDIFIETPGVVAAGNHDGTAINVNIRNAQGLNRVRVMVEGTQQESTGYQGYAGPDQRTYIDPDLIGGVEITKGPGGGPYGTGTTGGIVNVRLLGADDLVPEGDTFGVRLRGGIGGNAVSPRFLDQIIIDDDADTGLRKGGDNILTRDNWFGSIAGAYRDDHFEIVTAYARRKDGNYFAGKNGPETFEWERFDRFTPGNRRRVEQRFSDVEPGQEVPNTSEDTTSFLFKGKLLWGDGQSLEGGYMHYESEFGHVFPSNLQLWPPQQFSLNEVTSNRFWLRHKWESANDLINLQANVWHTNAEELGEDRQAPQKNDAWGVEVWNASSFDIGQAALTLTYGAEYSMSEAFVEDGVPTFGRIFVPGQRPRFVVETDDFKGKREVFGGHIGAALTPVDWLTLNAGVRYDRFTGESFGAVESCEVDLSNRPTADGFCGVRRDDVDQDGDRFSPRFGVTLEPFAGLQLFGQYSEGFRALSLVELGQSGGSNVVNPDLRPESVQTWEFGANYSRDGVFRDDDVLRAKLVYYHNSYDDFIARTGFSRETNFDSFFFENIPDATISGFEASLSYDVGLVFTGFTVNIFDKVEYCYVNNAIIDLDMGSTITVDGCYNRPPRLDWQGNHGQPEYAGSLTVGTRWFEESLVFGGRMNFFGESNHPIPDIDFNTSFEYWEPTTTFDLFGSYRVNEHISFNASAENVTDRYYLAPLSVATLPAPGRTVRIGGTIQF